MLNDLKAELARLYTDPASVERLLDQAGIAKTNIDLEGSIVNVWNRVVEQAQRRGLLINLINVARNEFQNSKVLQQVYGALRYNLPVESGIKMGQENGNSFAGLVRRLEVIVNGSAEWNVEGLVPSVRQIKAMLDTMRAEMEQLRDNQKVNRRWIMVLASICFLLLIALVALAYTVSGV